MIDNHVCVPQEQGIVVMSCREWKFDWKSFKRKPVYEIHTEKRCIFCGAVLERTPTPTLTGWGVNWEYK